MPRFQFRLQQYLGVKEQIESQKELEYGRAIQLVEEEKQKLVEFRQRKDAAVEELRVLVTKAISPFEIRRYNNNIERLKHQIVAQEERVKAAEAFAEQKRQELVQAMKERKALETVKENAREEFQLEANLAEQKVVDELVSFKYADAAKRK
ncbi:MAG: flagellar export protein FliJ [Defluviitaleaceae bacterium]|nr:flagellar export protein FliJ [Defluviitaleaceae bacterium]MCL2261774.1 flagellar export protein FliJ [Defluviitaleaceae bacterium]